MSVCAVCVRERKREREKRERHRESVSERMIERGIKREN
jgi:hypothetical protein